LNQRLIGRRSVLSICRRKIGRGSIGMRSQSFAGLLGAVVAIVALAAAVFYGPIGQFGKPPRAAPVAAQPAQPVPAAPAPRGPVIREVPN
jgi:hypothetical protein